MVSREQSLRELLDEARAKGISIHADAEAGELLDWRESLDGAARGSYYACSLGDDIFVRPQYADDLRILREELIHVGQQRAGIGTDELFRGEVEARRLMIRNRHRWGFTRDEVREIIAEMRVMREKERY